MSTQNICKMELCLQERYTLCDMFAVSLVPLGIVYVLADISLNLYSVTAHDYVIDSLVHRACEIGMSAVYFVQ